MIVEKYGEIIRKIRISKSITLQEIAKESLSVSLLSKFERGETDITISKFINILNRLNVTFDEFLIFDEENLMNEQKKFLRKLKKTLEKNNIYVLNKLEEEQEEKWKKDDSLRYFHNKKLVEVHKKRITGEPITKKDIDIFWHYLMEVDIWNYYEVVLYNNTMFCYTLDQISFLSKNAYQKLQGYSELGKFHNELILLLINTTMILLENNRYEAAGDFINLSKRESKKTKWLYEINKINFLEGIYYVKTGQEKKGRRLAEKAINTFFELNQDDTANIHQKYFDEAMNSTI